MIQPLQFLRPLLVLAATWCAAAHDIPADATVNLFASVSGARLQLLVRVPLKTLRDVDFPERAGGYLDFERLAPLLPAAAKVSIADLIELEEDGTPLAPPAVAAAQVSLPSDRSFESFDAALAHIRGPKLPAATLVSWDQVALDVLLEYPIHSGRARFSIRPGLEGLASHVVTVLRFVAPDGAVRAWEFTDDPGMVPLDPRWHQAALRFLRLGFLHILDGTDHLLFLLCLVIPLGRLRPLLMVVTAFTVAHSFTLLAAAYGYGPDALWFPPLIETLIAVSIVWMALENIAGIDPRRRWMMAFGFGLVHGFGFSFALRETLQFAGRHLAASLLAFNIGVELGQIAVLAVLVPALAALFRYVVAERMGTIILSALVAHTGWHWMLDRGALLRQFRPPAIDAIFLAGAMRWLAAILLLGGAVAFAARRLRRWPGGTLAGRAGD